MVLFAYGMLHQKADPPLLAVYLLVYLFTLSDCGLLGSAEHSFCIPVIIIIQIW